MYYLGRSKIDKTRRISLIKEVADLFDIADGEYVQFFIDKDKIVLMKETKEFDGYDFEAMEISDRIIRKGRQLSGDTSFEQMEDAEADEEERRKRAEQRYLKWKAERANSQKETKE